MTRGGGDVTLQQRGCAGIALGTVPAGCWAQFPTIAGAFGSGANPVVPQACARPPSCSAQRSHVPACPAALLKMAESRENQPAAAIKGYKTKRVSLHAAAMAPRTLSPSEQCRGQEGPRSPQRPVLRARAPAATQPLSGHVCDGLSRRGGCSEGGEAVSSTPPAPDWRAA